MDEQHDISRTDRAISLLADAISQHDELLEKVLGKEFARLDYSIEKNLAFVRRMQGQARLDAAAEERRSLQDHMAQLRETIKETVRRFPDVRKALSDILTGDEKFALSYRKLEGMDEDDIIDTLEDVQILRLWERLHKGDE